MPPAPPSHLGIARPPPAARWHRPATSVTTWSLWHHPDTLAPPGYHQHCTSPPALPGRLVTARTRCHCLAILAQSGHIITAHLPLKLSGDLGTTQPSLHHMPPLASPGHLQQHLATMAFPVTFVTTWPPPAPPSQLSAAQPPPGSHLCDLSPCHPIPPAGSHLCDLLGDVVGAVAQFGGGNDGAGGRGWGQEPPRLQVHEVEGDLGDAANGPEPRQVRVRRGVEQRAAHSGHRACGDTPSPGGCHRGTQALQPRGRSHSWPRLLGQGSHGLWGDPTAPRVGVPEQVKGMGSPSAGADPTRVPQAPSAPQSCSRLPLMAL